MSGNGRPIDMGPMYLPVGASRAPGVEPRVRERAVRAADARRLQAALDADATASDAPADPPLPPLTDLLARRESQAQPSHAPPDPAEPHAETDWSDAIERWCAEGGPMSERTLRIGARNSVLPGTAVHLCWREGGLDVRLMCETGAPTAGLVAALPVFARELAVRLRQPVRAQVEQAPLGVLRQVHVAHEER